MLKSSPLKCSLLSLAIVFGLTTLVQARQWRDSTGKYTIDGDLIAYNHEQVVIKKGNGELVAVTIMQLSKDDQDYMKSKESADAVRAHADRLQTWTFRNGYKASGRLVDYFRDDIVFARKRGRLYVNDKPLQNWPELYQVICRRVVAHLGKTTIETNHDIEKWLQEKGNQPQTFQLDGVLLEMENGDEYGVPFFLFSDADQEFLRPGWERWLKAYQDDQAKNKERFLLEAHARAYDLERQQEKLQKQQIQHLQLTLLETMTGVVALWEVALYPPNGNLNYPVTIVVPARDSITAQQIAIQQYPGFTLGSARRVSN